MEQDQYKNLSSQPPVVKKSSPLSVKSAERKDNLTFRLADGVDLEMVWIPAGTFMMGSPKDELGGNAYFECQHLVTLTKDFWIGKYPVTQGQYKAITGKNPSQFTSLFGIMKKDNPVENVSETDAIYYCDLLNEILKSKQPSGYEFSLPTEAQWEYACRAGTTQELNSGKKLLSDKEDPRLNELAWYRANSDGKTHPVGQKKPNAWGLYDMHGNVWERCLDYWDAFLEDRPVTDPVGPSKRDCRVVRGGSWFNDAIYCRSAYRYHTDPQHNGSGNVTYPWPGFRVALVSIQ